MNFQKRLIIAAVIAGSLVLLAGLPVLAQRDDTTEICFTPPEFPAAARTLRMSEEAAGLLLSRGAGYFLPGACPVGY